MSKLAIRGHQTRGMEVIQILETIGGINFLRWNGDGDGYCYIVDSDKVIQMVTELVCSENGGVIFTLEEFLAKYPFKIGDFVNIPEYESEVCICDMQWDLVSGSVRYMVCRCDEEEWYTAGELLGYNDCCEDSILYRHPIITNEEATNNNVEMENKDKLLATANNNIEELIDLLIGEKVFPMTGHCLRVALLHKDKCCEKTCSNCNYESIIAYKKQLLEKYIIIYRND